MVNSGGPVLLYKIYRSKLQSFLLSSIYYDADRSIEILPPKYYHELALALSRLDRQREVIQVYVSDLKNVSMAEMHCNRIWEGKRRADAANPGQIYLILLKVLIVIIIVIITIAIIIIITFIIMIIITIIIMIIITIIMIIIH